MAKTLSILGEGLSFPLKVDTTGALETSVDEANIRQSMMIILGTAKGERLYRPDFGCGIHDLLFEPNTVMTGAKIEYEVKKSLIAFEPRISELEVRAEPDSDEPNRMNVLISYTIRSTNSQNNMVYPFYLRKEGEV
ncbi:MAG: GPW/gp25 family protein [Bradymonadales bacterium]|jgi:phage baseplate assembly protein W